MLASWCLRIAAWCMMLACRFLLDAWTPARPTHNGFHKGGAAKAACPFWMGLAGVQESSSKQQATSKHQASSSKQQALRNWALRLWQRIHKLLTTISNNYLAIQKITGLSIGPNEFKIIQFSPKFTSFSNPVRGVIIWLTNSSKLFKAYGSWARKRGHGT